MKFFNELVDQSISRTREATLSVLSIKDQGLRKHLAESISDELGAEGCFLAPPVFEHTFGWEPASKTLKELSGKLLSPGLLKTLQEAPAYRFEGDMKPYAHQLEAWETLSQEKPHSTVITSGTGSGKTECFMLPILDDLIRETEHSGESLVGVRALFLYPLNALINSQQERLDAWTQAYGERIRFCLYNGMTEESASKIRKEQQLKPNQILSRETLRVEPAPILMTNSTMLEYMLVRQVDRPILDISRECQSLRWIVLDEAHTYIGSNAAEMSLLLRRVVQAFGKKASEIRFVATSATISGEDSEGRLAQYLADLAGVPLEQVSVIGGNREWPITSKPSQPKNLSLAHVAEIEADRPISATRYEALASADVPSTIRDAIVSNKTPLNLNEIVTQVGSYLQSTVVADQQREVLDWFNVMTNTYRKEGEQPFLKVRCHLFQRMLHGVWACIDPDCSKKTTHLADWPFGNVYVEQRTRCGCGAPVFELSFCKDCSTPHLLAEDRAGELCQWSPYAGDDFSLVYDDPEDESGPLLPDTSEANRSGQRLIIAAMSAAPQNGYFQQNLNVRSGQFGILKNEDTVSVNAAFEDGGCCSHCALQKSSYSEFYRRAHLGASFYVANAVPTVLEFCPDPTKDSTNNKSPEELPGRGRKLITFTDSRQGTARMAVRMQQEAERSRLRGLVFETLRNVQSKRDEQPQDIPTGSPEELLEQAIVMEKSGWASTALEMRARAEQMSSGIPLDKETVEVTWNDMVEALASTFDISHSILDYNKYTNPAMFDGIHGSKMMAQMLLAREFSRRPKRQNSLETLGLVSIGYQGLKDISTTPPYWQETSAIALGRGQSTSEARLTLEDWKHFLTVALDFHVRENTFLALNRDMQKWMGGRFSPKVLFPPQSTVLESTTIKRWPFSRKGAGSRLIKLLELASSADMGNATDKDKINTWLEAAWEALVKSNILEPADNGHRLNFNTLTFSLPRTGWVCPITHKILPTTFRSLTPYLPRTLLLKADYRCEARVLPNLAAIKPDGRALSKQLQIRDLVSQDRDIASLRSENLWTDISDRTVEGGFYYRTAEHSAQQSSKKLEQYEEMFKKGKINVLNCSTTMEMGVDIGGITAVVMNNLPPHPANYLQRSGRAGRRSESRSISYTLCKADPHNQRAFRNPQWPFKTAIPAPHITLSSDRIVQRHVNSFFLSTHLSTLTSSDGDRTKLSVQWFFAGDNSPCHQFIDWLEVSSNELNHAVRELIRGTALDSFSSQEIVTRCIGNVTAIQDRWLLEHAQINSKLQHANDEAYKKALTLELKRHEKDYLLRDLSARAFLPGHGFPTDVVSLNTYNIEDFIDRNSSKYRETREDNIFNLKEQPSRGLSVAIREYAPGAQVVIDGRVYICAGVSLQWNPSGFANEAQKFDIAWRCRKCGSTGLVENAYANSDELNCSHCLTEISPSQQRTILRPKGFSTDFYESTSNDISSQKFIRVEKPRVQLESIDVVSFPDPGCGHVRYGHKGSVFHHSSGDNEKGYAVCLTCGKAASMSAAGEIPDNIGMRPDQEHRPVGGLLGSHKARDCSGAAVKKDVYLGYQVPTDVVEFYLKNPVNEQWLTDSDQDRVIATTLAVGIRDVIADKLGIVSAEMGFSVRPDKDFETGVGRSIIQLYDQVSGGAGFVLAELADIVSIMVATAEKLDCPKNCENVCSHCLASQDSRVENELLDRKSALKWLTDTQFFDHLNLPDSLSMIPGAQYCSLGPLHTINRTLRQQRDLAKTSLFFALCGEIDEWNLDDTQFRTQLLTWALNERYEVWLGIPDPASLPDDLKRSLAVLQSLGVKLSLLNENWKGDIYSANRIAQIKIGVICHTLCSSGISASVPGHSWLGTNPQDTWIITKEIPWSGPQAIQAVSAEIVVEGAAALEITNELDGSISDLPSRIYNYFSNHAPQLIEILAKEKPVAISYTDRYLRSPWSALLLGEFMNVFKSPALEKISIETMAPYKSSGYQRPATEIEHDWAKGDTQKEVLSGLIFESTAVKPNIRLHTQGRTIQHGRTLKLQFPSGMECTIVLDQGMGYWQPTAVQRDHLQFNFGTKPEHQPAALLRFRDRAACAARATWPTFIMVILR